MKKLMAIAAAAALTALAGTALAQDTNTLTVTASVDGACKFNSATSSLAFGSIDPSGTTDATGQALIQYWCTKGVTQTISTDNGSHASGTQKRMQHTTDTSAFLPYELTLSNPPASANSGPDTLLTLTIDGTVASNDYRAAAAGDYQDVVEIEITP
jgi:spore coat protein U-like protein